MLVKVVAFNNNLEDDSFFGNVKTLIEVHFFELSFRRKND